MTEEVKHESSQQTGCSNTDEQQQQHTAITHHQKHQGETATSRNTWLDRRLYYRVTWIIGKPASGKTFAMVDELKRQGIDHIASWITSTHPKCIPARHDRLFELGFGARAEDTIASALIRAHRQQMQDNEAVPCIVLDDVNMRGQDILVAVHATLSLLKPVHVYISAQHMTDGTLGRLADAYPQIVMDAVFVFRGKRFMETSMIGPATGNR